MFQKLKYLIQQLKAIRRINKMDFISWNSGSIYYDGLWFTGHPTPQYLKRLHFLFNDRIHTYKESIQILFDIESKYNQDVNVSGVVIEVGAYCGFYAMKVAQTADKVYAIEAEAFNYEKLKQNISANNLQNIIPLNFAAWNKTDELDLNIRGGQENSLTSDIVGFKDRVHCRRIDDMIPGKVDFVRIQVNGGELKVLQGMSRILETKPRLEIQVLFNDKKPIIELLHKYAYVLKVEKYNIKSL